MAKITGVNTKLSGQVGEILYRQTAAGTVVSEVPKLPSIPQRTSRQMDVRTQWANLAAVYKIFGGMLRKGFESLPRRMSCYNAFIQANLGVVKVYITKTTRLNGGCVLAPYQITRGTLPSIDITRTDSGKLQSTISLGSLDIDSGTTVGEFSRAIIENNDEYMAGDQITFFLGRQTSDLLTRIPRASMRGYKIVLNTASTDVLHAYASRIGFSSVDGFLGTSEAISSGAAAWVHSRDLDGQPLRVSTQFLHVDTDTLARFQSQEALSASIESYGGINTSAVYLQPIRKEDSNG